MALLPNAEFFVDPWPYFTCDCAFDDTDLAHLDQVFSNARHWEEHNSTLYDGAMSDQSARVDADLKRRLVTRMSQLVGLPLMPQVQVNVQRMAAGQDVRPHSDLPLLGYEIARMVVQLSPDWRPPHGGLLQVHPDALGEQTTGQVAPKRNSVVGFVLDDRCHHSVTQTLRDRHSVVLYFWHPANSPALAAHLYELCGAMDFGALPDTVDDAMLLGESTLSESISYRAATVAWILHQWRCDADVVAKGYRTDAWPDAARDQEPTLNHTIELARWAASLRATHFDLDRWSALAQQLRPPDITRSAGERALWALAFPELED